MTRQRVEVPGGWMEVMASEPAPIALVTTHPSQWFGADGGPLFRPLAACGQVLVVNPRGTGGSSAAIDESATVAQLVEDLEAIRCSLGLTTWVMFGQSLGGCVAIQYALRHPAAVMALVLSCTTARGIADEPLSVYHPTHPDHAALQQHLEVGRLTAARQLVSHAAASVTEPPSGGVSPERHRLFAAELPNMALVEHLEEIAVSTLVIGGRYDRAIPVHHSVELAEHIPGAQLVVFEHSGHFPYLEEPDRFRRMLAGYLASHKGQ